MPWNDHIFIGTYTAADYPDWITARTNKAAVDFIAGQFPDKTIKSFELRKSTNARENALHLDCCFQPLGKGKAILHKNGFLVEEEYQWLVNFFGKENIEIVVSKKFNEKWFNISPVPTKRNKLFTFSQFQTGKPFIKQVPNHFLF